MVAAPKAAKILRHRRDPLAFIGDLKIPGADGPELFRKIWAGFQTEMFSKAAPCLVDLSKGRRPQWRGFWLERTKGASKDTDVACLLLWLLMFTECPLLIELGADKQEQAMETHKAIQQILHLNLWLARYFKPTKDRIVCTRTQSTCQFIATQETAAHGSRPNVTVCNELSHVSSVQFMETMMDNATKMPGNFAIIATNAGTRNTWQWNWRETYHQSKRWWFQKVIQIAPWLDRDDIKEAELRNSTSRFLRLWHGVWSSGGGDALDAEDIEAAIRLRGPMLPEQILGANPRWYFTAAIDAGVRHDHAALIVLGVQPGIDRVRLARCQSWAPGPDGRVDLSLLKRAVIKAHADFNLVACNFDPNQMEWMAQELETEIGLFMNPIPFTGPNCNQMARDLLTAFRGRQIDLYPDDQLVADLKSLTIVERKWGHKLEAPSSEETGHADRAIALAIDLPQALHLSRMEPPEKALAEPMRLRA